MNEKCLIGLHEGTVYRVRGKEGLSESWVPAKGLREGCSTSPILFNIYQQAVMRQADTWRYEQGETLESLAGGFQVVLLQGVECGRGEC